jgi:hypothetical protein
MKKLVIIFLTFITNAYAQDFNAYINLNAIEITRLDSLETNLYEVIKSKELILIGEMHGTNEPSSFVKSLSELILQHESEVCIGIELPAKEINTNQPISVDSILYQSIFFHKENTDGRNGKAWFDLIQYGLSNPKINLFFMDNAKASENDLRDSIMYLSVVDAKLKYPNTKIITLSGNIHNSLVPFRKKPTLGSLCHSDTVHFDSSKIISICHQFDSGYMYNNGGEGIQLREIQSQKTIYRTATSYINYILFYETKELSMYNCVFFTNLVTPSFKLEY